MTALLFGQPWWYWLGFLAALILLIGPPICSLWQERTDRRDAETWKGMWR